MASRVIVFIDLQNMYEGARKAFFPQGGSHTLGQFDPLRLAQCIAGKKPFGKEKDERSLKQVRLYCGMPESSKDPRTYGARRKQVAIWKAAGVHVTIRTLRYPHNWPQVPAEEKGIDVALGIDFATMGLDGDFDIGVIASTDTDLRPALEKVIGRAGLTVEVAAWHSESSRHPLSLPGQSVWCHRLTKTDYDSAADYRDYNRD